MDAAAPFAPNPLRIRSLRSEVSPAEWQARLDLAACYRLCDHFGMTDMIATHISARVPDRPNEFLVIAHGLLFGEVTASSLLRTDTDGRVTLKPEFGPDMPDYNLQPAAFVIHSDQKVRTEAFDFGAQRGQLRTVLPVACKQNHTAYQRVAQALTVQIGQGQARNINN